MGIRQVFLDTETTGLAAEAGDRVVEIGCVEIVDRRFTGRNLHFYLNPQRPSHEDALKVHGLTEEFLADKPFFEHIVDELIEYVRGAEVVIHNAGFDIAFLDVELRRAGRPAFHMHEVRVTDSLSMAREAFPGKSNSLDALCKRYEVNNTGRSLHGALLDAGLLAEVYIRMTRGQDSLVIDEADALAAEFAARPIDFTGLSFVVVEPDDAEEAAHAAVLAAIDKASGGKTVWRRLAGQAAPDAVAQ